MNTLQIDKDNFVISTDNTKLDVDAIHNFLSTKAYLSLNIPLEIVKRSIDNSLNFGLYEDNTQIGFARVISDYSTIAYLGDVYILDEYRGQGLSKWLVDTIMSHPNLQGLRRWILLTGDAHGLYKQYGWTELANPENWMELTKKDIYGK